MNFRGNKEYIFWDETVCNSNDINRRDENSTVLLFNNVYCVIYKINYLHKTKSFFNI